MHKDDAIRLRHMLDAAHEAIEFAQGRTSVDLNGDRKLALALVKDVEIIGMRHRLVHAYFDINLDIPWRTVQDDLPPLIAALERATPGEVQ